MFRPSLRALFPAIVLILACAALLLHADQPASEKVDAQGFPGKVTIHHPSHAGSGNGISTTVLTKVLVKSLGGRSFLVGTVTSQTIKMVDGNQVAVLHEQRVWMPLDEVKEIREARIEQPMAPSGDDAG